MGTDWVFISFSLISLIVVWKVISSTLGLILRLAIVFLLVCAGIWLLTQSGFDTKNWFSSAKRTWAQTSPLSGEGMVLSKPTRR